MVPTGVGWMFMILLGCSLTQATQPQNTSIFDEDLEVMCGPDKEVQVPCPYKNGTDVELKFKLLCFNDVISITKCDLKNETLNCSSSNIVSAGQGNQRTINYILKECKYGIYRCETSAEYPPPIVELKNKVRILVRGTQCKKENKTNDLPKFTWIWIMAVSVLAVYGLTVTIFAFITWVKLKKTDTQSDYMNTKPRAPRGHKKGMVQNPMKRF